MNVSLSICRYCAICNFYSDSFKLYKYILNFFLNVSVKVGFTIKKKPRPLMFDIHTKVKILLIQVNICKISHNESFYHFIILSQNKKR